MTFADVLKLTIYFPLQVPMTSSRKRVMRPMPSQDDLVFEVKKQVCVCACVCVCTCVRACRSLVAVARI